ncbi:transmembrane 6 superfamily member 1-like [Ylistrum balloti]|uniref:transmembrane 6 superfamily member 1-like n=1 Tax=Ylistrum balloti TaxID=509963 RepID=UPI002905ED4C|nr:transmembrane 6 superfamily member 1-like [Ylistrum balloti]
MDFKPTLQVLVGSFLAFPLTYCLNMTTSMGDHRLILVAGIITLFSFMMLAYTFVRNHRLNGEPFFFAWSVFAFTSCVDLIIGLELDGHISGFMEFYFKEGEPYLRTAHGTMINWWDGTGQYAMYLVLITLIANRMNCHEVCLYWVGSIGNSMIVLLLGGATGTFKVRGSYLLNVPYVVVPIWAGLRFLRQSNKTRSQLRLMRKSGHELSLLNRPWDFVFIVCFVLGIAFSLFRGVVALGCDHEYIKAYLKNYEPYLNDPNMFSRIQMLTYLFYFVPYYVSAIYGLVNPGETWMSDWAILHAGAATQSQVVHILASFHWRTVAAGFGSPTDIYDSHGQVFWYANLLLLVVPQLFAWRCYTDQEFFFSTYHDGIMFDRLEPSSAQKSAGNTTTFSKVSTKKTTTITDSVGGVKTTTTEVEGRVTRSKKKL